MSDPAAPDALPLTQLVAAGDIDVIAGHPPIPIAVWRIADAGRADNYNLADALTPRMAALLVASYTRPGDTIISLGPDPALEGAAGAGGRTYLPVDDPADLADLDHVAGTVRLIVLPWPPAHRAQPITETEAVDMFTTCRHLMARNGCTIVALTALPSGEDYSRHSGGLISATDQAGLGWLKHILAIAAPLAPRPVTWRQPSSRPSAPSPPAHTTIHVDLLVFASRPPRPRGGRKA